MTKARTLADFISDGSPLADGTISVSEVSGAAPLASPTFTGNVSLGDNDKAIFGAGSDLQIYHSGTNSFIEDRGTGNLYIDGSSSVVIRGDTASTVSAVFNDNGAVNLRYGGDTKLATTSTGVDITGTLTSDGLTVDGDITGQQLNIGDGQAQTHLIQAYKQGNTPVSFGLGEQPNTARALRIEKVDEADADPYAVNFYFSDSPAAEVGSLNFFASQEKLNILRLNNNGDISFYEDTGTAAKLTWDASAESLNFADNGKAIFGASSDLQIYHDGSHSIIKDAGVGYLKLGLSDQGTAIQNTAGANLLVTDATDVSLRHNGSEKLSTTSTGISVTGNATFADNGKAIFGAGSDLQIYHDGSHSYLLENGTGNLRINTDNQVQIRKHNDEAIAYFNADGGVQLYHDNSAKFFTTSTGIDVTGTVTADGLTLGDNEKAIFGAGSDLQIYHDGNSKITDVGDGKLELHSNGTGVTIQKGATEYMAQFLTDGAVQLYHDNAQKLATTSTGIDVTGNVTVTGTVDGRDVAADGTKLDGIAAGATNVTNNNQLTNGAGYTTYTANQALNTNSGVNFADVYANNWFRNNQSGYGLYNTATTQHFYSDDDDWWNVAGGGTANGIRFRDEHAGTVRGSVIATNSNEIGFLDSDSNWAIRHTRDSRTEFFINAVERMQLSPEGLYLYSGSLREDYQPLIGTSVTCSLNTAAAFRLNMSGNTTFTFSGGANGMSNGFVLELTGNGSTVTWPSSVKWAEGTAPDAPASGETDIYVFWSRDGGVAWYGALSLDAAS